MPKSEIVPCTKEEIEKIINASIGDDFYYMLFKVASKTGRRLGEYYEVQVKDVDFESKVMKTKILKRRQRVFKDAILDDELITLIKRYILKNKLRLDDYLFRKVEYKEKYKTFIAYRTIQNRIASYSKKAGITHKVSFHNFRHYFVTSLLKKGWSYDKISKLTGHSSIGTLAIYDHVIAKDIQEDARRDIKDL